MSPGSEPERDDSGLPPVDIEVPDDARDLDRDVQAYYREVRALRRNQRQTRWHRSLGRDGIMLPVLACFLILALITGTLLTVFTATSGQNLGLPGAGSSPTGLAGRGAATSAGPGPHIVATGILPTAVISVPGQAQIPLSSLRRAMLVLVPQRCDCATTLAWLADVAVSAHATAYVIYNQRTAAEVRQLYSQLDSQRRSVLTLAADTDGVLTRQASFPPGIPATKLSAVLVGPNRTARYAGALSPTESKKQLVQAIIT